MDPFTLAAIIVKVSATSLTAVNSLRDITNALKDAPTYIISLSAEIAVVNTSLAHLQGLLLQKTSISSLLTSRPDLIVTFDTVLTSSMVILSSLEDELNRIMRGSLAATYPSWRGKARMVWNKERLKELVAALRGLQTSFNVLIQLLQVDSLAEVKKLIQDGRPVLANTVQTSRSLRVSYPDIDVPESIYSGDDDFRSAVESINSHNSRCSDRAFMFDDEIVNSRVYRRALEVVFQRNPVSQEISTAFVDDLIDLSEDGTIRKEPPQNNLVNSALEDLQELVVSEKVSFCVDEVEVEESRPQTPSITEPEISSTSSNGGNDSIVRIEADFPTGAYLPTPPITPASKTNLANEVTDRTPEIQKCLQCPEKSPSTEKCQRRNDPKQQQQTGDPHTPADNLGLIQGTAIAKGLPCHICGIQDEGYEYEGKINCRYHFAVRCAQRCAGCLFPILGPATPSTFGPTISSPLNPYHWHHDCFEIYQCLGIYMARHYPKYMAALLTETRESQMWSVIENEDCMELTRTIIGKIFRIIIPFEKRVSSLLLELTNGPCTTLKEGSSRVVSWAWKVLIFLQDFCNMIYSIDKRRLAEGLPLIRCDNELNIVCDTLKCLIRHILECKLVVDTHLGRRFLTTLSTSFRRLLKALLDEELKEPDGGGLSQIFDHVTGSEKRLQDFLCRLPTPEIPDQLTRCASCHEVIESACYIQYTNTDCLELRDRYHPKCAKCPSCFLSTAYYFNSESAPEIQLRGVAACTFCGAPRGNDLEFIPYKYQKVHLTWVVLAIFARKNKADWREVSRSLKDNQSLFTIVGKVPDVHGVESDGSATVLESCDGGVSLVETLENDGSFIGNV